MKIHDIENTSLETCTYLIGIDEAGRGPLAGPVTVGAVLIDKEKLNTISLFEFLNDSKKLTHKRRVVLEKNLMENIIHSSISDVDVETIDRINILEATKLGILNTLEEIILYIKSIKKEGEKIGILIDGKFNNIKDLIDQLADFKDINYDLQTIVDGDALCPSIAAASILAKEHRDALMGKLHIKYPEYAFDKHKGYGTKLHMERLNIFGPSEIHRKSFAPVRNLL